MTYLCIGLDGGKRLGIEPIFGAQEMADPEVEHLGIMAYAAHYTKFRPVKISLVSASFSGHLENAHVGQEVRTFCLNGKDFFVARVLLNWKEFWNRIN